MEENKKPEEKKEEKKIVETKKPEEKVVETKKHETKPEEKKKKEPEKPKKTEAIINGKNVPISTKYSVAICKFIKGKKIGEAIKELEQVSAGRKAIPMKGEIPHRKGKIMSGRFPKKASETFIVLLKSLLGNANVNGLENAVITDAVANFASRPYGRFGRIRKKRTHINIIAKSKKEKTNGRKKNS